MYRDLYLRFADEAEANGLLYTTHEAVLDPEGNVIAEPYATPNYTSIDVLGVLYEQPDPEVEPVQLAGWHVNVRLMPGEDAAPLELFAVVPTHPRRIWG